MTTDALSLPHLRRGEMVSVIGGLWESEAIGSGKASGVVVALGNSIVVVFPHSERHIEFGCAGIRALYWAFRPTPGPQSCRDGAGLTGLPGMR